MNTELLVILFIAYAMTFFVWVIICLIGQEINFRSLIILIVFITIVVLSSYYIPEFFVYVPAEETKCPCI